MKLFGIELKQPEKSDWPAIGLSTLIGLLLIYPLSNFVAPQIVLAWTFAGFTGAVLYAMGVSARAGIKHILLIIVACLPMHVIGYYIGIAMLGEFGSH